jgi:hypothetical protein
MFAQAWFVRRTITARSVMGGKEAGLLIDLTSQSQGPAGLQTEE